MTWFCPPVAAGTFSQYWFCALTLAPEHGPPTGAAATAAVGTAKLRPTISAASRLVAAVVTVGQW